MHNVLFDLIDELARACDAKSFHVGMDEVFILADPDCPRCKGKSPAELFALEVTTLQSHLASIGCRMWMWGDRFIDGKATGIGEWEASTNDTAAAIDQVPKDIVICDWHYEKAHPTPLFFAAKGFDVVACPCARKRSPSAFSSTCTRCGPMPISSVPRGDWEWSRLPGVAASPSSRPTRR